MPPYPVVRGFRSLRLNLLPVLASKRAQVWDKARESGRGDWISRQNAAGTRQVGDPRASSSRERGAVIPTSECGDSRCKKNLPPRAAGHRPTGPSPRSTDLHSKDSPSTSFAAARCIFACCCVLFHTSAMAMELRGRGARPLSQLSSPPFVFSV